MEDEHPDPGQKPGWLRFFKELRRRKVFRVAVVYLVVGWLVLQVASVTFPSFDIPSWGMRLIIWLIALGFPVALVLAWAFELTPEGIKTTQVAREEHAESAHRPEVQRKRNWLAYAVGALFPTLIFGSLALFFYIQTRISDSKPEVTVEEPSIPQVEELEKSIA